ncbi:MAG TPA: tetratricopeptide repeat protein [Anaeromyxobacter sp.]
MAGVAELIDRGVKLYTAGRIREAREAFQRAVDLDPSNEKARAYLLHIRDAVPAVTPFPGTLPPAPAAARPSSAALPPIQPAAMQPPPTAASRGADRPNPAGVAALAAAVELAAQEDAHGEFAPSPWEDGPAGAEIQLEATGGLDLQAVAEKSDLRPLVPEGAPPPAAPERPKSDVDVWLSAAKELFALGDFTGSLELIEKILQVDPDHGEARDYLRHNEATLVSMYESKIAPLTRTPRLAIKPEEVMWLNLDHRAGFLLAQIDGTVDYETLFALSGLPRLDTARILANLIAEGVITS